MPLLLKRTHLLSDVLELGIAIRVINPFFRFPIDLQTIIEVMQQSSNRLVTDDMFLAT